MFLISSCFSPGVKITHTCMNCGILKASQQKDVDLFPAVFPCLAPRLHVASWASPVAQLIKNPPAMRETWFGPWVGKTPWRRERLPTPVFLAWRIPMDRGAWQAIVHGIAKNQTRLSDSTAKYNVQGNSHKTIIWLFNRNFAGQKIGMLDAN